MKRLASEVIDEVWVESIIRGWSDEERMSATVERYHQRLAMTPEERLADAVACLHQLSERYKNI
jgi:hypothetical protein